MGCLEPILLKQVYWDLCRVDWHIVEESVRRKHALVRIFCLQTAAYQRLRLHFSPTRLCRRLSYQERAFSAPFRHGYDTAEEYELGRVFGRLEGSGE